jgi:hypothetical protein
LRPRLEDLVEHGVCGLKLWKDLGTSLSDEDGKLLRVDDERLAPLFEKAAELGVPSMFHTADPDAFFLPIDPQNERYEELAAHPDWSFHRSHFSKSELLVQRDRVFARHPKTTFVAAHVAERPENLEYVGRLLETYPNVSVDIGARCAELGRQPYTARNFFLQYSHRILFGTDLVPESKMYRLHFRFLETDEQYFEYPSHAFVRAAGVFMDSFFPMSLTASVSRECEPDSKAPTVISATRPRSEASDDGYFDSGFRQRAQIRVGNAGVRNHVLKRGRRSNQ